MELEEFSTNQTSSIPLTSSNFISFLIFLYIQFLINLASISKKLKPICQIWFCIIENIHIFANNK